jgi:MYXO-CTERM domain-containing protein
MRRLKMSLLVGGTAVLVLAAMLAVRESTPQAQATTLTSGVGGELTIGSAFAFDGKLYLSIDTSPATDPYIGFSISLQWDTSKFTLGDYDYCADQCASGNKVLSGHKPLCLVLRQTSGATVSCQATDRAEFLARGSLVEFRLTQTASDSCSNFHIVTLNGPDNGDVRTGSYTFNTHPQLNTYGPDATECSTTTPCPGACPTSTPTGTSTMTPTSTPTPVPAPIGPTIEVGTPSVVLGEIRVPVLAAGTGFNPYHGWQVHLTWDPTLFQFGSSTEAGGMIDPAQNAGLCLNAIDAGGGGALSTCDFIGTATTVATGLMATFTLEPIAFGCSTLHLVPGGGLGTYTLSVAPVALQINVLVDGSVCNLAPTPTPTATSTATVGPVQLAVGGVTDLQVREAHAPTALPSAASSGGDYTAYLYTAYLLGAAFALLGAAGAAGWRKRRR